MWVTGQRTVNSFLIFHVLPASLPSWSTVPELDTVVWLLNYNTSLGKFTFLLPQSIAACFVFIFTILFLFLASENLACRLCLITTVICMYMYVHTQLQTSTSLLNFSPALAVIFPVYHTFGGWGQGKGMRCWAVRAIIFWIFIIPLDHLWLILTRMWVLFQWFRAG